MPSVEREVRLGAGMLLVRIASYLRRGSFRKLTDAATPNMLSS
jgi:hypothetical protein